MIVDHHQGYLKSFRATLSIIVYPLQYAVNLPIEASNWLSTTLISHTDLLSENKRLKEERLLLNTEVQRYKILEKENQRLRTLLESSAQLPSKVLIAKLIAVEPQLFHQKIILNKGTLHGAYEGQPIIDANGIMGQIINVSTFSSTVLLITDPNHALPIEINRNGLRAIAVGSGKSNQLLLENLPNNADIQVDDLIVSSGLGQRFPTGYPVGKVEEITPNPSTPFAKVTIKPSAKINQSREVLMIWPGEHHELMRLLNKK